MSEPIGVEILNILHKIYETGQQPESGNVDELLNYIMPEIKSAIHHTVVVNMTSSPSFIVEQCHKTLEKIRVGEL